MINFQDRNVQIAIGLGLVLLALKWGFSGDFQFTRETLAGTATIDVVSEDGKVTSQVLPRDAGVKNQALDLVWGVLAIVGMVLARIGSAAVALASIVIGKFSQPQTQAQDTPQVSSSFEDTQRAAVLDLARAAKKNDQAAIREKIIELRRPDALKELQAAYVSGDRVAISALTTELDSYLPKG